MFQRCLVVETLNLTVLGLLPGVILYHPVSSTQTWLEPATVTFRGMWIRGYAFRLAIRGSASQKTGSGEFLTSIVTHKPWFSTRVSFSAWLMPLSRTRMETQNQDESRLSDSLSYIPSISLRLPCAIRQRVMQYDGFDLWRFR